jgi:hypothetical protein
MVLKNLLLSKKCFHNGKEVSSNSLRPVKFLTGKFGGKHETDFKKPIFLDV